MTRNAAHGGGRRVGAASAVLAVGILLVCTSCGSNREESDADAETSLSKSMSPADSTEADSGWAYAESRTLPVLVDLGADKCVPCKMMAPILDEMRGTFEGQLKIEFIDVWKDPDVGKKYGVRVIPTQIFYDGAGNELFRHQGFFSREDILAKWREFGYEFEE